MSGDKGLSFQQACDEYFDDELTRQVRATAYGRLLTALQNETLKATGIRTKPTVELKPSLIPPFLFDKPKIDWFMDTVENAGSKFEQVRVHSPAALIDPVIGRPSKSAKIDNYLVELQSEGVDIFGNQKRVSDKVREKAAIEEPSLQGFSYPVIKSRIRFLRAVSRGKSGSKSFPDF